MRWVSCRHCSQVGGSDEMRSDSILAPAMWSERDVTSFRQRSLHKSAKGEGETKGRDIQVEEKRSFTIAILF